MKATPKPKPQRYLWHKIVIMVIGLVLSVVLHEAFHIGVHWGEIESISFFQGESIAEIIVTKHSDSDIQNEEIAAYLITLLVIFFTVMIIYRINDATDTRTVRQILSEDSKDLQKMKSAEFAKLVGKTDLAGSKTKSHSKSKKSR